jgi:hypothetical protein
MIGNGSLSKPKLTKSRGAKEEKEEAISFGIAAH